MIYSDDEAGPLDSIAMASSEDSEETEELGSSGSFAFADSKPVENTVKKVLATPAVRRIGSEHGIDLSLVGEFSSFWLSLEPRLSDWIAF